MGAVTVIKDPHSPTSFSSKSCHNMMEKGLESSYLPTEEINKSKIKNMKNERVSKSKATTIISTTASKKHCLCAPTTHPGSFKCRFHRAATTTTSHIRIARHIKARHIKGDNYSKNLNFTKLVAPSKSGGVKNSNKANVHGQHGLSRFGRAALAAAASAQVQTISAALRQMSLN